MAAPQRYADSNDCAPPSAVPAVEGGTTVLTTSVGRLDGDYLANIAADTRMYTEVQDLIAKWCEAAPAASGTGLGTAPRAALKLLLRVAQDMYTQTKVA